MTIQDYMQKNYPDHFASGKWNFIHIGLLPEDCFDLPEHGWRVSVGVTGKYWVWLDKD